MVATGEFLLGYLNESNGRYTLQPEELSLNSSFAAFRILEQDVPGFERFLQTYAAQLAWMPKCWRPKSAAAGATAIR
ncbi:Uncharacterised protein [Chromobacterium violaceum]|uniref:Uncharacterized protein n=1 Tax=Chromobacterium violaceum TaxID=536 RepID=A0A447TBR7_CHRVL|nr:Uncharacterised protein [Chromobacterium violaceum]